MKQKGISAIIATILLLLITIALAASVYVYMSGMIGSRISKTISVLDASCSETDITLVISNDGTNEIKDGEVKIFVNNVQVTGSPVGAILPHETNVTTVTGSPGSNSVLVLSPSNPVRQTVFCQ